MGLTIGLGSASGGKGKQLIDVGFVVNAKPVNNTLTEIPLVDTSYLNSTAEMFSSCSSVEVFPKINTSRVTTMYYMYKNCTIAESFPELDMKNVENGGGMFYCCFKLKQNPPINAPNLKRANYMFNTCKALERVSNFNAQPTQVEEMFANCESLHTVELLDLSRCTQSNPTPFWKCPKLVTCNVVGLQTNMSFADSPLLSKESVLFLFENAQKVSSTCKITLHADTFNQLTADEIAIATQKKYSVVSA